MSSKLAVDPPTTTSAPVACSSAGTTSGADPSDELASAFVLGRGARQGGDDRGVAGLTQQGLAHAGHARRRRARHLALEWLRAGFGQVLVVTSANEIKE